MMKSLRVIHLQQRLLSDLPEKPDKATKYCDTFNISTATEIQANLLSRQWSQSSNLLSS